MSAAISTQSYAPAKDNLLGICHAIGEDFGFNPIFLRLPLAMALIADFKWTLIAYAAMGIAVLVTRLLVRRPKAAPAAISAMPADEPAGDQVAPAPQMALAA